MTNAALVAFSVVHMIARIVTGEVCVVPEAAPAVAAVAVNRLDIGWGYAGWNAIAEEPADWALDAAWGAWKRGGDPEGELYAISGDDLEALGFDVTGWRQVGSDEWPVWVGRRWD